MEELARNNYRLHERHRRLLQVSPGTIAAAAGLGGAGGSCGSSLGGCRARGESVGLRAQLTATAVAANARRARSSDAAVRWSASELPNPRAAATPRTTTVHGAAVMSQCSSPEKQVPPPGPDRFCSKAPNMPLP